MANQFVIIEIVIFLLVNYYSPSWALRDLTKCITYRYAPCQDGLIANVKSPADKNEEIMTYNATHCTAYRFLACKPGEKPLTITYEESPLSKTEKQMACDANINEKLANATSEWLSMLEAYNKVVKEKKFLSTYMASVWTGKKFDEHEERSQPIKDRMLDYIRYSAARLGLPELKPPNVTQLRPEFGPIYNDILTFRYPITIAPYAEQPTPRIDSYSSLFVAVTGFASANSEMRRNQIRNQLQKDIVDTLADKIRKLNWIKFAFFLGTSQDPKIQRQIEIESQTYKDIVQIDILDTAANATLKMAAVLNWVRLNCGNVNILFKVDENYDPITLKTIKLHFSGRENEVQTFAFGVPPNGGTRLDREYSVLQGNLAIIT